MHAYVKLGILAQVTYGGMRVSAHMVVPGAAAGFRNCPTRSGDAPGKHRVAARCAVPAPQRSPLVWRVNSKICTARRPEEG